MENCFHVSLAPQVMIHEELPSAPLKYLVFPSAMSDVLIPEELLHEILFCESVAISSIRFATGLMLILPSRATAFSIELIYASCLSWMGYL
jgi:hypothetical protein